jgi:hypothetical protein
VTTTLTVRAVALATLGAGLAAPLFARSMIHDILAKGSEWTLNVDGEVGTLTLLGGRGSRTSDGGWEMTMDVEWQGNPGTLNGWQDGENREQRVALELVRRSGIPVTLSGYIARETDAFMAGTSRSAARPEDIEGAWYATRGTRAAAAGDGGTRGESGSDEEKPGTVTPAVAVGEVSVRVPAIETERPAVATCRVAGRVSGEKRFVGGVAVYSSDPRRQLQKADLAPDGTYRLRPLPDGVYTIRPLAGGKFDLRSSPRSRNIRCRGSQAHRADFEILGISEG